jgi:beta-glucanase (GH16 family)
MKRNYLFLILIITCLITQCHPRLYKLEKGYIYLQKEKRSGQPEQWQLVWADEFNDKELDTSVWTKINYFNDEDFGMTKAAWLADLDKWDTIQNIGCFSYTSDDPQLYSFNDGMLYLHGIVNEDTQADPRPFLQGAIKSKRKFAFRYGRLEIRAKLEAATGSWPAFWMLSELEQYEKLPHRNGEIDIMERLNYEDSVYQTTHSHWTIDMGNRQNPPYFDKAWFDQDDFNVFALEWYPDKLVYMVNGKVTYEYPRLANVDAAQWPFDQPFFVMLDQQLGGSWVGEVDPEDLPASVIIDWIRLYQ